MSGLQYNLTDPENGNLNIQAINCLRQFKVYGDVVWGARTLQGNDQAGSEWKYVPIRRLALFLESSLYDGTQWVVFEPNDEPLWSQIRLNIGAFMQGLFLQGAFQGTSPQQAYFVKCDRGKQPPAQHRPGHGEHSGGLRSALSRRVRGDPDPAIGRSNPSVRRHAMAQFPVNTKRVDPYKNFKFRLKWDGKYVYGGSKVTGLKRSTEVVEHRSGGDPVHLPQIAGPQQIRSHHAGARPHPGPGIPRLGRPGMELSARTRRGSFAGEFSQGHHTSSFTTKPDNWSSPTRSIRCWVSEYQALPDLDANANAVAIEHIKIEHEGFVRDTSVTEPQEPTLSIVSA